MNRSIFATSALILVLVGGLRAAQATSDKIQLMGSPEEVLANPGRDGGPFADAGPRLANVLMRLLYAANNEPDVATRPLSALKGQLHPRYLRSAASQQYNDNDESTLRSRLPELIAQAHTDKNTERALLRWLINTRLAQQQAGWRPDEDRDIQVTDQPLASLPRMSARLEQALEEYASMDPALLEAGELGPGQAPVAYQSFVGKRAREYLKPCSFNAISCAGRNPFRGGKGGAK